MSHWTPEQRQAAAQKRAAARAPLLAHAGLVQTAAPKDTHADHAEDFRRRMAEAEQRSLAHIEECRTAIAARDPERFAAVQAEVARLERYRLETAMIANHWSNAYRALFGRLPPHLDHIQRALDEANAILERERAGRGEQLSLLGGDP